MQTQAHNSILTYLNRLSARERLDMREPVQTLQNSLGWSFVKEILDGNVSDLRKQIEWDGIQDQAEYAAKAGVIRGLQQAQAAIEAIVESGNRAQQELLDSARVAEGSMA